MTWSAAVGPWILWAATTRVLGDVLSDHVGRLWRHWHDDGPRDKQDRFVSGVCVRSVTLLWTRDQPPPLLIRQASGPHPFSPTPRVAFTGNLCGQD